MGIDRKCVRLTVGDGDANEFVPTENLADAEAIALQLANGSTRAFRRDPPQANRSICS